MRGGRVAEVGSGRDGLSSAAIANNFGPPSELLDPGAAGDLAALYVDPVGTGHIAHVNADDQRASSSARSRTAPPCAAIRRSWPSRRPPPIPAVSTASSVSRTEPGAITSPPAPQSPPRPHPDQPDTPNRSHHAEHTQDSLQLRRILQRIPTTPERLPPDERQAGAGTPSRTMTGKTRSVFFSYSERPSEIMR